MEPDDLFKAVAIGMQTLVGIDKNEPRPSESGNCFGVFVRETTADDIISWQAEEYRIVNFKVENLNALLKLGLTWPIQCKLLAGNKAIIHDGRIGEQTSHILPPLDMQLCGHTYPRLRSMNRDRAASPASVEIINTLAPVLCQRIAVTRCSGVSHSPGALVSMMSKCPSTEQGQKSSICRE